jgi:hypothetical protein
MLITMKDVQMYRRILLGLRRVTEEDFRQLSKQEKAVVLTELTPAERELVRDAVAPCLQRQWTDAALDRRLRELDTVIHQWWREIGITETRQ